MEVGTGGLIMYVTMPLLCAGIVVGLTFLLKNKPMWLKRLVVISLAFFNLAQHIFKAQLYPSLGYPTEFSYTNTAYNVCAFMIIIMPFVYLIDNAEWSDLLCFIGTFGAGATMFIDWYLYDEIVSVDCVRFYTCHIVLVMTSILPPLIGMHKIQWKRWWKLALNFMLMLVLILFNNVVCVYTGWYHGAELSNLADLLYQMNPITMMHPDDYGGFLDKIVGFFTPDVFMQEGRYAPIAWFAIPLYIMITVLSFGLYALIDRQNFKTEWKQFVAIVKMKTDAILKNDKNAPQDDEQD